MKNKFKTAIFLAVLSFLVYSFFQFSGFQGYEDETYKRIVTNLEMGEFKTARSGYAQTLLETPFVLKGQLLDKVFDVANGKLAQFFALLYNPFITATSVAVIFLIFTLYCDRKKAFWLSLVYAFGTMAFPYASIGMEPTAVLFILLSVYFLFRFGKYNTSVIPAKAGVQKNKFLILSGLFFFLLFFSKAYYFVTLPAFLLYVYLSANPVVIPAEAGIQKKKLNFSLDPGSKAGMTIRNCVYFASPLLIILPLYLLANKYNFGAYFGGQYKLTDELLGGENPIFGIYGLLLSFGKSLFIYNPVLILSVVYFKRFYNQHKNEALFMILYSLFLILFVGSIHWWSDETWGPRYLLSLSGIGLLPLIAFPTFLSSSGKSRFIGTQTRGSRRIKMAFIVILLTFSFLFQLLGSLSRYDVFPYSFYEIYGTTQYNVLASQGYQYIPQFAPYLVNYQLIKNKIFGKSEPLEYQIIYTPPMEMAARERGGELTNKIVYDNNKYQAHVLNFWWQNVPGVSPYALLGIFIGLISFVISLSSSGDLSLREERGKTRGSRK